MHWAHRTRVDVFLQILGASSSSLCEWTDTMALRGLVSCCAVHPTPPPSHLAQGVLAHFGIQWVCLSMARGLLVAANAQRHAVLSYLQLSAAEGLLLVWY